VKSFPAHGGGALSVAFASDGRLVTAGRDCLVKLWNADAGHVADLTQTDDVALAAVFAQGDKRVVVSDWSGKVRIVDIETKQPVAMLTPNPPTLAQRVEEADESLADLQAKQTEATTLSTEKGKALQLAQQAHDAFNKRLADAQLSQAAAQRALDETQAVMKGRTGAEARASETKTAADTALAEMTKKLEEARKANAPNVTEFVAAVADADSAVHAAAAALGETQTLRVEAEGLAGQTAQRKTAADQLLAEVSSQRAGLPDLTPLQTEADAATQALNGLTQQVAQATTAREAAIAERERYAAAADELAKRAEQTLAEVTTLEAAANEAASREAEAMKAADAAAEATKALQAQLETIKEQIRDSRAKQAESTKSLADLEAEAAAQQAKLSEAQRRAQVAEALLEDLKKTSEWHAEQVAKE
jgi:chromosome segregation ATPase